MKLFRQISLLGIICLLFNTSCEKKESPKPPTPEPQEQSSISFSSNSITVRAEACSASLSVMTSGSWTITGGTEWCSVSPSSGSAGTTNITLTFTENTADQEKSTTLVGKCGSASATVVVTQKEKSSLTVTSNKFEIGQDGGNIEVVVKTNIDFDVSIPSEYNWIKYISTKAVTTKTVTFSIDANSDYDKRNGYIIIKDKSSSLSDTVRVYQAQRDAIVLSQSVYNVPTVGGNLEIEIKSNVEFEVKMPEVDWLSLISTKALSSHTIKVAVRPNETYESREAEIIFTDKNSLLSEKVMVHQAPTGLLIISQKMYEIGAEGGVVTVPLQRNIDVELEIKNEWIHMVETKGVVTDSLVFQISANPTYYERSGKIVVIGSGTELRDTVCITQAQKNFVSVEESPDTISDKGEVFGITVKSNVDVKVHIPDDCSSWLRRYSTKAIITQDFYFEVDANAEFEQRKAVIYFYHEQIEDGAMAYITQLGNTGIKLSQDTLIVPASEGSSDYSFLAGSGWSVLSDRDWCHIEPVSGETGSVKITVIYQENKQFAPRQAKVTIKTTEVSETFVVKQEARPGAPKNGISTYAELKAFRVAFNEGKDISQWQDDNGVVNLIADIVMPYDKESWIPIKSFNGVFDGNGFSIDSMYVKQNWDAGLFGTITSGGVVKNLIIKKGCHIESITSSNDAYYILRNSGSICGNNKGGTISNCENETFRLYGRLVGGICGLNYSGVIEGCRNKGPILVPYYKEDYFIGGICGINISTIRDCINESSAYAYGTAAEIGGIAGRNEGGIYGSINYATMESTYSGSGYKTYIGGITSTLVGDGSLVENCTNYGQVTGYRYTGGIAGYNGGGDSGYGIISNSTNHGKVIGNGKQGGGIVGINYCGDVISCVNKGQVTEAMYAGGIVGYGDGAVAKIGKIDNCTNEGSILATSAGGGICGYNRSYSRITNSSNSGSIESMGDYAGGVCGYNETNGIVYNCTNTGSVKSNKYTGNIIGNDSTASAPQITATSNEPLAKTRLTDLIKTLN